MTKEINYLDLAKRVDDMLLCNDINNVDDNLELENGEIDYCYKHESKEECDNNPDGCEFESRDIYQSYLIDKNGADYLKKHTNEIVFYSKALDLWVWGITHFGTPWNIVYTTIEE